MKNKLKKGFTIIELIVVVAILGILVLLAGPKLLGYVEKAELTRIQHDVKVMENKMAEVLTTDNKFNDWQNNGKDLGRVVMRKELYEKQGVAKFIDWEHLSAKWLRVNNKDKDHELGMGGDLIEIDDKYSTYKIIPKEYSYTINTKLKGTFYVNSLGKVYYEHDKPLTKASEKEVLACVAPETLNYEFSIIDGKGTITGWTGTELHLIIPSSFLLEVDGVEQCVPVQVIGKAAFANGPLKSIVIPESVDTIEEDAFRETELTEVTIPHSVEYIGDNAFADTPLTNAIIVNKPEYIVIGENAFGGVTPTYKPPTAKDLNIIFDTKTNTIISGGSSGIGGSGGSSGGSEGSSGSSGGSSGGSIGRVITIPKFVIVNDIEYPVKEISQGAYQGSGLISVIMPEGLERIEDYAFAGNQLIGVTIPESVNYIGNYAFAFNEATHTITGDVKGTIKSVVIKGEQYIDNIDGLGNITKPIDGITLKDHIFIISSMGNHVIKDIGANPEQPEDNNEDVNNKEGLMNPIEPREPVVGEIAINSADELANIGLNGKYILTSDIDLSGIDWVPIGTSSSRFRGSFDGNGYSITGLTINSPTTDYIGLLGYTDGATIENVALENVDITGASYTGGLVGRATSSTNITNSYATGSVTGARYTGGLVGLTDNDTEISNSYATGKVTGTSNYTGGLVGIANSSSVTNSYATGSVTGTGGYTGGLVGEAWDSSTITNSYATGSVTGTSSVGGLVGLASSSTITNSYATGKVTGTGIRVGGLVGYANQSSKITNSYATGSVTGEGDYTGGLVGRANNSSVTNSYATGEVTGTFRTGGLVGEAWDSSTITNSYATGSVTSTEDVGGLVGVATSSTITNSYATGKVTGTGDDVGGLVGYASSSTKITNSYATGKVTGTGDDVGGLVGWASSSTKITNSYWNTETTEQDESAGGEGKTTDEMKMKDTYRGWDFGEIWQINEGKSYPTLR